MTCKTIIYKFTIIWEDIEGSLSRSIHRGVGAVYGYCKEKSLFSWKDIGRRNAILLYLLSEMYT